MKLFLKLVLAIACLSAFFSCNSTSKSEAKTEDFEQIRLSYAKRFAIKKTASYTVLELFGNRNDTNVTASFVLYKDQKPNYKESVYFVKVPVKRIASMSSIYSTMLDQLNTLENIIAIDNVNYYSNEHIQELVSNKHIAELSKGPKMDIEKTMALQPDLILTFGMGNPNADIDAKIIQANLPVAISLDHLEETPLGRYEWIKFVACFVGKENLADSLFKVTEERYNNLKKLVSSKNRKPKVLTEMKYGDVWYVPAGNSYVSNLIADAGGDYIWKEDKKEGSIPLSFENVFAKAKDADFWINTYNINSKEELISHDERYGLFKAFKENKIYNNNKTQNNKGFSNYWEQGIIKPDEVLADLISIFYPGALQNHVFSFYKKIE